VIRRDGCQKQKLRAGGHFPEGVEALETTLKSNFQYGSNYACLGPLEKAL